MPESVSALLRFSVNYTKTGLSPHSVPSLFSERYKEFGGLNQHVDQVSNIIELAFRVRVRLDAGWCFDAHGISCVSSTKLIKQRQLMSSSGSPICPGDGPAPSPT